MPTKKQWQEAVNWALQQYYEDVEGKHYVTKDNPTLLVDTVRQYFNINNIEYSTFSYADLEPYLSN